MWSVSGDETRNARRGDGRKSGNQTLRSPWSSRCRQGFGFDEVIRAREGMRGRTFDPAVWTFGVHKHNSVSVSHATHRVLVRGLIAVPRCVGLACLPPSDAPTSVGNLGKVESPFFTCGAC